KELANQYDYISIADWYQAAKENPNIWINTDLVHFNLETDGATIFATTIKDAVEASANGPIKN
ncbi:MAG: acetyltransferase, partial [Streptococcus suis]